MIKLMAATGLILYASTAMIQFLPEVSRGGEEEEQKWVSSPPLAETSTPLPTQIVEEPTAVPTSTPLPAPTFTPVERAVVKAASISSGVERWRDLVATIFDADDVDGVLRIMQCESGGDPIVEGIGGRGLMQINPYVHGDYEYWRDPVTNLQKAYALSRGGTQWWPWDGPTPGRGQSWYDGAPCR